MVIKNSKNYYEILGVTPDIEIFELKTVYRRLVRQYHPDINPGSEKLFKDLTEAYETLSDAQLRKQYDMVNGFFKSAHYKARNAKMPERPDASDKKSKSNDESAPKVKPSPETKTESNPERNAESSPNFGTKSKSETQGETFKETFHEKPEMSKNDGAEGFVHKEFKHSDGAVKFENFKPRNNRHFSNFLSDIMDGISGIAKKTAPKPPDPKKGEDIFADITIPLKDAVTGTHRIVNIMHTEVCPNCNGRKFINGAKCTACDGKGEMSKHQKINVTIPAHIKNGSKLRIAGEGNRGYYGGKNGDLYLNITILPHANFRFDGLDVLFVVPITTFEAALGGEISVPALEGDVVLKLPPATQSGQVFRISSKGLKKNNKIGDIIITVRIQIPKKLSDEELELYRRLKKVSSENLRENLLND